MIWDSLWQHAQGRHVAATMHANDLFTAKGTGMALSVCQEIGHE